MREQFREGGPGGWVGDEHAGKDMLAIRRQTGRIIDMTLFDLGMQSRHALIVKGHFPTDENIKHDAKAPDVHFRADIRPGIQELRRGEVERATEGLEGAIR